MGHEGEVLEGALRAVAEPLRAGLRPLPTEIQRALDAATLFNAEGSLRCDAVAVRDWSVLGPQMAKELLFLADAASRVRDREDLIKIFSAAEGVLAHLQTQKDKLAGRFEPWVTTRRMVADNSRVSKGSQRLFTDEELRAQYESLLNARDNWRDGVHCTCYAGKTCKHFKEIEEKLFTVAHLMKYQRGEAVAGQRKR